MVMTMDTRERFGIDDAVFERVMGSLPTAPEPNTSAAQILAMARPAPAAGPVVLREVRPVAAPPRRTTLSWKAAAAVLLCAGLAIAVASVVGWQGDPAPSGVAGRGAALTAAVPSAATPASHLGAAPVPATGPAIGAVATLGPSDSTLPLPVRHEPAPAHRDEPLAPLVTPSGGGLAYASVGAPPLPKPNSNAVAPTGLLQVEKELEYKQVKATTRMRLDLGMLASRGGQESPGPVAGPQLNVGLVHLGPSETNTRPMLQANVELAWLPSTPGSSSVSAGLTVGGGAAIDGPKVRLDLGWDVGVRGVGTPRAVAESSRLQDGLRLVTGPRLGLAIPTSEQSDLYLGTTLQGAVHPGEPGAAPSVQPWIGFVAGGEFPVRQRG